MARRKILSDMARNTIAKSYHAGTRPSELAAEWGVSMSYVINVARAYDTEQKLRKLAILEKQERERITPPPMTTPMPPRREVVQIDGRPAIRIDSKYHQWVGTRIVKGTTSISLPYVSMQEAG